MDASACFFFFSSFNGTVFQNNNYTSVYWTFEQSLEFAQLDLLLLLRLLLFLLLSFWHAHVREFRNTCIFLTRLDLLHTSYWPKRAKVCMSAVPVLLQLYGAFGRRMYTLHANWGKYCYFFCFVHFFFFFESVCGGFEFALCVLFWNDWRRCDDILRCS